MTANKYTDPPKTERVGGVVYHMAAGTFKHADAIRNLFLVLGTYFRKKNCKPYTSELEIYFDADNVFRPDISVICDFSKMKDDGYHGAPSLIVEVLSPSTAKRDRGIKFECYQDYGVREYWIVSPENDTIEQYVLTGGRFQLIAIHLNISTRRSEPPIPFHDSASFFSAVFAELKIDLDEIFQPIDTTAL